MKKQTAGQYASDVSTHDLRCMARIMRSLFIAFLLCILILYGCSSSEDTLKLPFNSDIITQYYYTDDIVLTGDPILKSEYKEKTVSVTPQEASVLIKGWQQYIDRGNPPDDYNYYEIGRFQLDGYQYKLIIYNRYGDADIFLLNIQLNSYAPNGNLRDALLLGSLYGYEECTFFSKFAVDKDIISMDYYSRQHYDLDAPLVNGKVAIIENPIPELYLQERYQMDNGFFELIHRDEKDSNYKELYP